MKNNKRKLNACLNMLGYNFYTCSISNHDVRLSGIYSSKLLSKLILHKFELEPQYSDGFIRLKRSNVEICLTD